MISTQLVILLLAVAALVFYAGYQFGRQAPGAGTRPGREMAGADASDTLPEPRSNPLPGPRASDPPRPRSAPPPASAGGGAASPTSPSSSSGTHAEPRRSSPPPPARAGLLDPGKDGGKK